MQGAFGPLSMCLQRARIHAHARTHAHTRTHTHTHHITQDKKGKDDDDEDEGYKKKKTVSLDEQSPIRYQVYNPHNPNPQTRNRRPL